MPTHGNKGLNVELEVLSTSVIDSHAHISMIDEVQSEWSAREIEKGRTGLESQSLSEIVEQALALGVSGIVECACDLDGIRQLPKVFGELDSFQDNLRGAVAIHPNEAPLHLGIRELGPDGLEKPRERRFEVSYSDAIAEVYRTLTDCPQIRAVGETGLDFFRTAESGRAAQIRAFQDHLQIAKELNLPVQIHDREAHREVLEALDGFRPSKGSTLPPVILHSFSGDREFADECLARGCYL
jgi:TatD DNase family protein